MLNHTAARTLMGLTAATFGLAAAPAFAAPDANATAEALKAVFEAGDGGATVTWEAATATETDVSITNFVITNEDGSTATFPKILIVNPVPRAEGGFTADRATFDGAVMVNADQTNVTWQTGFAETVTFPSVEELDADARIVPFARLSLAGIDASGGEIEYPFTVATLDVALANVIDGRPNDITLTVADMVFPASIFEEDPDAAAMVEALGYDSFVIDVTLDGAYDPTNDTLNLRNIAFGAQDVGELTVSGALSSFPLGNVLQGLAASDEDSRTLAQQALAEAKLDSATITFTNTGIVNRVLEQQARAAGATPEQFAAGMAAALPFMLTFIGDAALQEQVAGPLGEFIINPNNIVVTAAPTEPVAVMAIIGAGVSGAIGTLPGMIGLDIKANQ